MSSSQSSRPPGTTPSGSYRQDYIVRIRYNNTLPPPLAPPKLLDIPNHAFAQYTDPTFITRVARSMPPTIEVDSELGMPLDLHHTPSVFEGDDAVLRALNPPPAVDPRDRALLRPAAALGKPMAKTTGGSSVSFLRRTEYISAEQSKSTFSNASLKAQSQAAIQQRRAAKKAEEESDPVRILAATMRGFDTANPETKDPASAMMHINDPAATNAERNWKECRHPTKPHLRPVETFSLLPHLPGTSDIGGYMVFKFTAEPTDTGEKGSRDERADSGVFMPVQIPVPSDNEAAQSDTRELFDYYLPTEASTATAIKRKFQDFDEDLSSANDFRYKYVRRYETKSCIKYEGANTTNPEELALVFRDGKDAASIGLPRGAYFYPIIARYLIRPRRKVVKVAGMSQAKDALLDEDLEQAADMIRVRVRELNDAEKGRREEFKAKAEGTTVHSQGMPHVEHDAEGDEDAPGEEDE